MEFNDLGAQRACIAPALERALAEVLESAQFISGPQVKELEGRLAAYVGRKHCVTCGNGTDAIEIALIALGVGHGDAVFVPDFTFFASAEPVARVGAEPIFVDIDPDTFNMDADDLERRIDQVQRQRIWRPRVIIPVDLFGLPANYAAIEPVAKRHGLRILEDAAQGFGGTCGGKKAGGFGEIATTSFFPAKPLGCYGDGGAIFTDDDSLAELMRSLCVHGKGADKYDNVRIGVNSRLDTIQAAVLLCKLDVLNSELPARDAAAARYTAILAGAYAPPTVPDGFTSSWAQYTVRCRDAAHRARVMAHLKASGVPSMIYYSKPMHRQTAFAYLPDKGAFPQSDAACEQVLSLPMHPYLTKADQDAVIAALLSAE